MVRLPVVALAIGLFVLTFTPIKGQDLFGMANIVQYLAANDGITKQLIKIAQSLQWLKQGTNGNPLSDSLVPMLLDALPGVFNSGALQLATHLSVYELQQVPMNAQVKAGLYLAAMNQTEPNVPIWGEEFNETLRTLEVQYRFLNADWPRAANTFLTFMSARDVLSQDPQSNTTTVHPQCYSDTVDFVDAVIGTRLAQDMHNLQHYGWALQMFDSFGKVSGGLMKGSLYYPGSFDECNTVHAYIPANASLMLGNRSHDYVTEFDTRFCRVTFDLPDAISNSFGVDTHGIQLRLHWGICMPATCHSHDVSAMFNLGMAKRFPLNVHSVYCTEKQVFEDDASAVVAAVIVALLAAVVAVCTLYEAFVNFYNNNCAPSPTPTPVSSIEDPTDYRDIDPVTNVYHNPAFVADGKEHQYENVNEKPGEAETSPYACIAAPSSAPDASGVVVPVSYVAHREGTPVFKDNLPPKPSPSHGERPNVQESSPPPSYSKTARNLNVNDAPKFVKAFSLLTNMPKLLSGAKSPSAIHCLHGIRFFSLCWVILGHTYNYGVISVVDNPTTVNLIDADSIFKRFTFQGIMAGGYAVDTFFLLSGFLVTWLTLRDIKKKNSVGYWVMFYVHRFWRLTPLYMVVIVVFSCLHTYMGSGPLWPQNLDTATSCKKYWWTNLLYINNLVNKDDMCLSWTWYLANDMQFYWISPIFLLALTYQVTFGILLTVGLLCGGIAASFVFEYRNGGDVFSMKEDDSEYWNEVYITPWCRVAAYAVGMLLGFIFHKFKRRTLDMKVAATGWVITWVVGLILCYITFTKRKAGGTEWVRWFEALFESVGRPLWAACVGWIIFASHNNRGGFINSILSWEGFLPLSRLTYAAYLVHPVVMMIHVYSKRSLIYISDFDMAYLFMGHFVTSFLAAFVISVCAEAPALALEKLVFRMR